MVFIQLVKISKMIDSIDEKQKDSPVDSNELDAVLEIVGSIIENISEALS